uniref:Uncharacterized protein n=1 Tax=viral metagenome TaxID=1070528 RepID=A0A6C0JL85_9ZZZZ
MKKKNSLSVYIALLFLIFLVLVFPYKEGFDTTTVTTTRTGNTVTTSSYNFFEYYWPFSGKFLQYSENVNPVTQGDTNIDTRTNNTAGYNDVDYVGFNTAGTGNDGRRYTQSV